MVRLGVPVFGAVAWGQAIHVGLAPQVTGPTSAHSASAAETRCTSTSLPHRHPFVATTMCGIFFSLSRHDFVHPDSDTEQLLKNRGPDSLGTRNIRIHCNPSKPSDETVPSTAFHVTFVSTVLSLRGTTLTKQPLQDEPSESILCWNGEAWSIAGQPVASNDSRAVFDALLAPPAEDISDSEMASMEHVVQVLSSVRGPYAFVFYDARNQFIYYGRDCLGRRSLLNKVDDNFVLSSVCDNHTGEDWEEVDADGIYVLDLKRAPTSGLPSTTRIPHQRQVNESVRGLHFVGESNIPRSTLNRLDNPLSGVEPQC